MSHAFIDGGTQPDQDVTTGPRQAFAGGAIGILVLDLRYPLFPGNVANASTWDFPVMYKILTGAALEIFDASPALLDRIVAGGRELQDQGARAIVGACGYFANYQKATAAALEAPVFLSSLLQVPVILQALKPDQQLGILCAVQDAFTPYLQDQVGITDGSRLVVRGAQDGPEFKKLLAQSGTFNSRTMARELVDQAVAMVEAQPAIGALLLECSDMPPYAHAIQHAIRRPVFDFTTMVDWIYRAVVRRPFHGFI